MNENLNTSDNHNGIVRRSPRPIDCAVIIVTYNSRFYLDGLLHSLVDAAVGLSLRVIVVDNGSTDGTVDMVAKRNDVISIKADGNRGYAAGINIGRTYAGNCSALLVLNSDVLLEAGSVTRMFDGLQTPGIGIVVPKLMDRHGKTLPSLRREPTIMRALGDCFFGQRFRSRPGWSSETVWEAWAYEHDHTIDWATGAVMMIGSECDQKVGPWDERFFLYSEETDYAARARSHGFRIKYLSTARAQHAGGGSGASDELTALMAVNRIRYAEIWGRWPTLFWGTAILRELMRAYGRRHRTTLRILLQRSRWSHIFRGLQEPIETSSKSGTAITEVLSGNLVD